MLKRHRVNTRCLFLNLNTHELNQNHALKESIYTVDIQNFIIFNRFYLCVCK